jgi:hypothetical protein
MNYLTTCRHFPKDNTRQEQTFNFMKFWRKSFTLFAGEGTSSCKKPGKPFSEVESNSKRKYVQ